MTLSIPACIDIADLYRRAKNFGIKPFKPDHLNFIFNALTFPQGKNKQTLDEDGYIRLSSSILKKFVANYRQYLNFLICENIIQEPAANKYLPGHYSKSYRINFSKGNFAVQEIIVTDNVLQKKFAKIRTRKRIVSKYKQLTKWLNKGGLKVNLEAALAYADKELQRKLINNEWEIDSKTLFRKDPYLQRLHQEAALNKIASGALTYSVDDFGLRLHSTLVTLSSGFRKFISYEGERLVSIDIKNCQPYLLIGILTGKFGECCPTAVGKKGERKRKKQGDIAYIMLSESLQLSDNEELNRFIKLVIQGQLYEYLAKVWTDNTPDEYSRDRAKRELLRVLFSDNRYLYQSDALAKRIFRQQFPGIYNVIAEIKKTEKNMLARLLQRMESFLVLQVICGRISRELPNAPIYTIHDSIISTEKNISRIKEIINCELTRYIGYPPTLSIERWEG